MNENELSKTIIGSSIRLHKALKHCSLESAYQECLYYSFYQQGLFIEKEKVLPLIFDGIKLQAGYRVDILA